MSEKPDNPSLPTPALATQRKKSPNLIKFGAALTLFGVAVPLTYHASSLGIAFAPASLHPLPINANEILLECAGLQAIPSPPAAFASRLQSDRYEAGTRSHLIKNATIWTGSDDGEEVIRGDVLLENGLIKAVGNVSKSLESMKGGHLISTEAHGAWLTPGIFDLHSHIGVDSVPELRGADDTNSLKGLTLPWLRSLDGINVHDEALRLSISGGVTSALILPGSADAIGGQAFVIKLRRTSENSPTSMVLEPPFLGNDPRQPPRWRHMKHATGENPSRVYSGTRMDTMWAFRSAYEEARKLKEAQDAYCVKAQAGLWNELPAPGIPKNLKWEALTDVLRGKVKINIHSYSPSDFDGLARLSNEFKFHIAAIHHAHSAYLVTPLLEKFYGGKPAVALFATNARYKQEAYRGSEFSPKILNDRGFRVVMKSDHPVMNSRNLLYEAVQAHIYGLPANKAIQSVTTTSAAVAGFGHRLGHIKVGYDADVVLWDSHPLSLGATPRQVFIDGIPQLHCPVVVEKPGSLQEAPSVPDWSKEAEDAIKYQGLPPLMPTKSVAPTGVLFKNVRNVWGLQGSSFKKQAMISGGSDGVVHFDKDGSLICSSFVDGGRQCIPDISLMPDLDIIDLKGGSLAPGLVSFGGNLGNIEIEQEASTNDGRTNGELLGAVDGLSFQGRNELLAYRAGVTVSVVAPVSRSTMVGVSAAFNNGAAHKLEKGAIVQNAVALHIQLSTKGSQPSVSTQIASLRTLLLDAQEPWVEKVVKGETPLIIHVHSADIIASILLLKTEVEAKWNNRLRLSLFGGLEAHLLAKEIAAQRVGVIVSPPRSFPIGWESRRILPGPPLSHDTDISVLLAHNVTVGIGIVEGWEARNQRFDLSWISLETGGRFADDEILALGTSNLVEMFGLKLEDFAGEYVAYRGGDIFDTASKVVGVISRNRGRVDVF